MEKIKTEPLKSLPAAHGRASSPDGAVGRGNRILALRVN